MYLKHYNLREKPFQISTDPKFLWLGDKHEEGLSTLKYGILDNKGFLVLTGDVGTGKTTLINSLLNSLEDDILVMTVFDPSLDALDFFNYIANGFGLDGEFATKGQFLIQFSRFLHKAHADNKKVLLIVDEAHRINDELLEEIRLLSNLEKPDAKLLNIFFVGQKELNAVLLRPENRALKQRITIKYNIGSLSEKETGEYIYHRLKIAGLEEKIFNPKSIQRIFMFSEGVPRLINILCDHAMLTAYAYDKKKIDVNILKECTKELAIEADDRIQEIRNPATPETANSLPSKGNYRRMMAYVLLISLLLILVTWAILRPELKPEWLGFIEKGWSRLSAGLNDAIKTIIRQISETFS